jgi:hypothetical protein
MAFVPYGNKLGGVYPIDSDGNHFGFANVGGGIGVCSKDFYECISEGDVSGSTSWSKIGYLPATVASVNNDLWYNGGNYVYATTGGVQLRINSTSASDAAAGVGIQKVNVYYLDNSFNEQIEEVTLAGTATALTTAKNIIRVQGFRASACGTTGASVGVVAACISSAAGTTLSVISTNLTRARNITYTVPANKELHITSIKFAAGSGSKTAVCRFITRATYDDKVSVVRNFFMPYTEIILQDSSFASMLEMPLIFPAKVDIKVSVFPDTAGAQCCCALRGFLHDV